MRTQQLIPRSLEVSRGCNRCSLAKAGSEEVQMFYEIAATTIVNRMLEDAR